jgi:hypothetical protein
MVEVRPMRTPVDAGPTSAFSSASAFERPKKTSPNRIYHKLHRRPTMSHAIIARAAKQEAPDTCKLAACLGLAFLFHFVPYLYLDFLTFVPPYIFYHSLSLFQPFLSALCIDVRSPCCIVEL